MPLAAFETDLKSDSPKLLVADQPNHLAALTGMRFFAAFAVVIGHLISDTTGDKIGQFGLPHKSVVLGGAAVSFFFVLSGFILTYVYNGKLSYKSVFGFYFKRWARIWPLHLVCFLIAVYVLEASAKNTEMVVTNLALLQSWVPDAAWIFSFNGVSWSISTEMFFYAMFPLLLIGGQKRFWIKYVLIWGLAIAVVFWLQWMANQPEFEAWNWDWKKIAHVNPFLRLPEFCSGMAIGYLFLNRVKRRQLGSVGRDTCWEILTLLAIPLAWYLYTYYFKVTYRLRFSDQFGEVIASWVMYVWTVSIFSLAVYVFAQSRGLFARLFGSRALVFGGEISFALYMVHYLVLNYLDRIDWSVSDVSPWTLGGSMIVISLCLAVFLYKLVEMPAKSFLLDVYAGKFKSAFGAFPTHLIRTFKTPVALGAVVLLAATIGLLKSQHQPLDFGISLQEVVADGHLPYRDVEFGAAMRLMGVRATAVPEGVRLEMVWQKIGPLNRSRFMHLCDSEGKIVTQVAPQTKLFEDAPMLQPVLESCLIPNSKLEDPRITQVGVGFYSNEIDPFTGKPYAMLPVSKGPRGMDNFRLHLVGENQMKNLRKVLENLQAKQAD
ncbi:MAG: peptidoglycan/LPS O-acetylase OafA/YrhL [Mariniblastus sp.]